MLNKKIILISILFIGLTTVLPQEAFAKDVFENSKLTFLNDSHFNPQIPEINEFINNTAVKLNINAEIIENIIRQSSYVKRTIELTAPRPKTGTPVKRNWPKYRKKFINNSRLNAGVSYLNKHYNVFEKSEKHFGVPMLITASILSIESRFGNNTGRFNTRDALASLAFYHPTRKNLFQKELAALIELSIKYGYDLDNLQGSYAGAIGMGQFLPSSIKNYAIDFNDDGVIDLNNTDDAIGSVANYLRAHGWVSSYSLDKTLIPIRAGNITNPDNFLEVIDKLQKMGVKPKITKEDLIYTGFDEKFVNTLTAPLTLVDLPAHDEADEYRLGNINYYTITRYNRSFNYATAVLEYAVLLGEYKN